MPVPTTETQPAWLPSLADVAAYVTSRTIDNQTPGNDTPLGTFTANTYPTATQVTAMREGAVGWVRAQVATIDDTLVDLARAAAALRTAGLVELSFPIRDADVNNADELLAQADTALAALTGAQQTVSGALKPVGSFPPAPRSIGDFAY